MCMAVVVLWCELIDLSRRDVGRRGVDDAQAIKQPMDMRVERDQWLLEMKFMIRLAALSPTPEASAGPLWPWEAARRSLR